MFDNGTLFVDSILQDDLLQLLNSLILVPGCEAFTTVLSPQPLPNTTWFGRDRGALTRKITKVFTNKFDGPYYSWKLVPRDKQERYFIEFAKTHTWEPLISGTVQQHFEAICKKRMKGIVSTVRTSRQRPTWIKDKLWKQMVAHWDTVGAKKRSLTTSKARKSDRKGLGPHIHLSGHKSYEQIQQEMEEELGRPVSIGEVFIRTHTKRVGTFVDRKAHNVTASYKEKLSERKAQIAAAEGVPRELTVDEENEIFLQCTFKDGRGRPFGVGSLENTLVNGKRKHPGSSSGAFYAMEHQLQAAQCQIEEQAAVNARREEEFARVVADQQKKLDHFSLVENFLRATDPAFVDFVASQPAPSPPPPTPILTQNT